MDVCTRDNIYYLQVLKEGYEIDAEEADRIKSQAAEELNRFTDSQIESVDY